MIDYVEVRNKNNREVIGIIDGAKSIIWHSVYFGVGDFEIYAIASQRHLSLLKEGNYITRPNEINIGIIENVRIEYNAQDGRMIIASGRFAKSILDRRQIYNLSGKVNTPTILRGNVESAVRSVVANNAISCSFDTRRNIPILELGASSGIPLIIVDDSGNATQKQVSYQNLLEYTDGVLEEYGLGSIVVMNDDTLKLQYIVYMGTDHSVDNTDNNEIVIFSTEFDNLTESNYAIDTSLKKNAALIGGEGEGLQRFYSAFGTEQGLARRETWIDASSINKTYEQDGEEKTYTDAEYKAMLDALGKQKLAELITVETLDGTINVTGGAWHLNEHYSLGDKVTLQDNELGLYINVRITEITEIQDENGYSISATYSN